MRKPFWTYLACCIAVFMISMDNLIVTNALPVIRQLEGIASGTSNALRQVGTVLGIAVLGSVFSAAGGLGSPGQFTTGLTAALTVSAAILGASALVVLLAPETRPVRQASAGTAAGASADGGGLAVPYQRRGATDPA